MSPHDIHPPDCPEFEYAHHPDRGTILPFRVRGILADLRKGAMDTRAGAADTRGVHKTLFTDFTPPGHEYFAGHYRGENYRCLRQYQVWIGERPGEPARIVPEMMRRLAESIRSAIAALDAGHSLPNSVVPADRKLLHTVQVACRFFELVCRVHPYANGNGHAARFCVWAILARYGYFPNRWPIDPRPPDPPYTTLLLDYRAGKHEPLERHILSCLV